MSTQTTVSFLTYDGSAPVGEQYTSQLRVFNLEISQQAQTVYIAYMTQIQNDAQQLQTYMAATPPDTSAITNVMEDIGQVLQYLDSWSQYQDVQNGQQVTNDALIADPTNPGQTVKLSALGTMDRYTAQDVDTLLADFRAAGYDPITQTYTNSNASTQYELAQELFGTNATLYNVTGTISQALSDVQQAQISTNVWSASQSIQQLLMVDYISTGNELLFNEMSQLNTAINTNQNALTYLNSLQDLMNQKDPQSFIMALQDLSGTVDTTSTTQYSQFEQDTFNQQLQNVAKFSNTDVASYLQNILGIPATQTPTAGETAGAALGSFQALSPDYLNDTLNQYLSGQNLTNTTTQNLMPALSDNPTYATPLSTFATTNSLSTTDQQLIWQTFLTQEAGTNLPSTLCTLDQKGNPTDVVDQSLLTNFTNYLTALGNNIGSAMYTTMNNQLMSDAHVSNLTDLANYCPSQTFTTAIENEITSNFTSLNLTSQDVQNIFRGFLGSESTNLGVLPTTIDMTLQPNLDALGTYAQSISNTAALSLTEALQTNINQSPALAPTQTNFENTLMSDAGVSSLTDLSALYPPNIMLLSSSQTSAIEYQINSNFTAYTLTDDQVLDILRAFLVKQGAAQGVDPTAVDMTLESNLTALGTYAQSISNQLPQTEADFTTTILDNDLGMTSMFPANLDWNTFLTTIDNQWNTTFNNTPLAATPGSQMEVLLAQEVFLHYANQGTPPAQVPINNPADQSTFAGIIGMLAFGVSIAYTAGVVKTATDVEPFITPNYSSSLYPPTIASFDWYKNQIAGLFATAPFTISEDDEQRIIQTFVQEQNIDPATADFSSGTIRNEFSLYLKTLPQTSYVDLLNQLASDIGAYPPSLIDNGDQATTLALRDWSSLATCSYENGAVLSLLQAFGAWEQSKGIDPTTIDLNTNPADFITFLSDVSTTITSLPSSLTTFNDDLCHYVTNTLHVSLTPTQLSTCYPPAIINWDYINAIVDGTFTAFPLSDDQKLQVIQGAIANYAATQNLQPTAVNPDDPGTLNAMAAYVAQLSKQFNFLQTQLLKDSNSPDLATLESLQPPSLTLSGWDNASSMNVSSIIDSAFSSSTLSISDTDKQNILRAFLVTQAKALSTPSQTINPEDVDMTDPKNLEAFATFATQLATQYALMPVSYLTSVPDTSINPYGTLLNTDFSISKGYTADDQLNIWKAFLISQGLTTDANIDMGVSATSVAFNSFITAVAPYIKSTTGGVLENGLYTYLITQNGLGTISSQFSTIAGLTAAGVGYPTNTSVQNTLLSTIQKYLPTTQYSAQDYLNIWRSYLIYTDTTDADYTTTSQVDTGSWLNSFAQDLQTQIGTNTYTGSSFLDFLGTFALYPHQSGADTALTTLLNTLLPTSSYSAADQLNFWEGFLASSNSAPYNNQTPNPNPNSSLQPGDFTKSVITSSTFLAAMNSYINSLGELISPSGSISVPTGQNLVNLLNSARYQYLATNPPANTTAPATLDSLASVTAAPAPTTLSQYMNNILGITTSGTNSLTSAEQAQIWDAFLASNASKNGTSIMQTNIMDPTTLANFTTFLNSMSKDDLGSSIETRIARIISNLQYLIDQISQIDSGSSLATQLQTVLNDFKNCPSITAWVQDYQSGQVGNYQNDLNDAIVASQGLNDTEREQLQNVMFVYEEFYKSSTSMLSDLNNLLLKMADAISRQ